MVNNLLLEIKNQGNFQELSGSRPALGVRNLHSEWIGYGLTIVECLVLTSSVKGITLFDSEQLGLLALRYRELSSATSYRFFRGFNVTGVSGGLFPAQELVG